MDEFRKGFCIDDTGRMADLAEEMVYFTDNAGEIVFDRLFIEYSRGQVHGSRWP